MGSLLLNQTFSELQLELLRAPNIKCQLSFIVKFYVKINWFVGREQSRRSLNQADVTIKWISELYLVSLHKVVVENASGYLGS